MAELAYALVLETSPERVEGSNPSGTILWARGLTEGHPATNGKIVGSNPTAPIKDL